MLLPNLEQKYRQLIRDDHSYHISPDTKKKTLVIQFLGVNDFISATPCPSSSTVNQAIAGHRKNVEKLIRAGYQHFIVFSLPDLSIAPRFLENPQKKLLSNCFMDFNAKLESLAKELQQRYPHCRIDFYDCAMGYKDIFENPEKYNLDSKKITKPFKHSLEFKPLKQKEPSPAPGFFYWDDVHTTDLVYFRMAEKFSHFIRQSYLINPPSSPRLKL